MNILLIMLRSSLFEPSEGTELWLESSEMRERGKLLN